MSSPLLRVERDDDVVTLTFNDPDRRNAMTQAMGQAFSAEITALAGDESLRAVVLTGEGRAFSGGGDLSMIGNRADEGEGGGDGKSLVRDTMRAFYPMFLSVRDLPCPTLAAVNGHAIGAGLCVALACDIRFVAREAKLALNFSRFGLHPGMAATWTLPRLVAPAVAAELLYTGRIFDGQEAVALGVASRVLPAAEVLPATQALAREIAIAAPLAVRGIKQALRRSATATLEEQLDFEASQQAECFATGDVREGLAAAREKRDPVFRGR